MSAPSQETISDARFSAYAKHLEEFVRFWEAPAREHEQLTPEEALMLDTAAKSLRAYLALNREEAL